MKKIKITIMVLVSLFLIIFYSFRGWYSLTDNFSPEGIVGDYPFYAGWEVPNDLSPIQLKLILDQPFHYLSKGAQIFAFESSDKKYVIKFFKFKHSKPSFFVDLIPPIPPFKEYKEEKRTKKRDKIINIFNGYVNAFKYDSEETGLVYLHLNKTPIGLSPLHITDKMGRSFVLPLDKTVFVLQKKGQVLKDVLSDHLKKGNIEGALSSIESVIDMYIREYQRGILDNDHGITHNSGFFNGKPLHFDVGKIAFSEEFKQKKSMSEDLKKVFFRLDDWLVREFPKEQKSISPRVKEYMEKTVQTLPD